MRSNLLPIPIIIVHVVLVLGPRKIASYCYGCIDHISNEGRGHMGACPPVVAGNFVKVYYFCCDVLNFYVGYFVQSNIQHVSLASGVFAPRPPPGLCPGPRWGTSIPRPLVLPP